jgi:hypothetical protein
MTHQMIINLLAIGILVHFGVFTSSFMRLSLKTGKRAMS